MIWALFLYRLAIGIVGLLIWFSRNPDGSWHVEVYPIGCVGVLLLLIAALVVLNNTGALRAIVGWFS